MNGSRDASGPLSFGVLTRRGGYARRALALIGSALAQGALLAFLLTRAPPARLERPVEVQLVRAPVAAPRPVPSTTAAREPRDPAPAAAGARPRHESAAPPGGRSPPTSAGARVAAPPRAALRPPDPQSAPAEAAASAPAASDADPATPLAPGEPGGSSGGELDHGAGHGAGGDGDGEAGGVRGGTGRGRPETVAPQLIEARERDLTMVRERIARTLVYPDLARRMRWQGRVVLAFVLSAEGALDQLRLVESCGIPSLDAAALEAVRRAAPFPGPGVAVRVEIPVTFKLQSAS